MEKLLPRFWPEEAYHARLNKILNILHGRGSFQERWECVVAYVDDCAGIDFQASIGVLKAAGYQLGRVPESPPLESQTANSVVPGSPPPQGSSKSPETSPSKRTLSMEERALIERNRREALAKRARKAAEDSPEKTQEIMNAMQWI
jgi:hypothetical protein